MATEINADEYFSKLQYESTDIAHKLKSLSLLIKGFNPDSEYDARDLSGIGYMIEEMSSNLQRLSNDLDCVAIDSYINK